MKHAISLMLVSCLILPACEQPVEPAPPTPAVAVGQVPEAAPEPPSQGEVLPGKRPRFDIYAQVTLNADLGHLSARQREMVALLIEAAAITDDIFWQQVWGDKEELLARIDDPEARQFAIYNYGPWDRLDSDQPFLAGFGPRPPGANFYPRDMTKAEFEAWEQPGKDGQYSLVRRDAEGDLILVPYHDAYAERVRRIAGLLRQAAGLAEDEEFAHYLELRADALLEDDYRASDMAWMDVKHNPVEVVIGPVETYQDALYGYRAAYETFVLIKDLAWSERLERFAHYLPQLQRGLPVPEEYKQEMPGSDADLNAYDVAYCAGDCNSGAKTIAINLPNDEQVQLTKGTRRLQLKNAMRAKFSQILVPIADELIAEDQRRHVTFDSFFGNTMFHEVAHGLGIKNTLDGAGTVRQALREHASALEEGKADILGLYMVQRLRDMGEIEAGEQMDDYVTFLAGIFRSVRFGASSAHGRANMIRFNYFKEAGAFSRDPETGRYRVNVPAFEQAIEALSRRLLVLQGDGRYEAVTAFIDRYGAVGAQLQADLDRLAARDIPVDIVYRQGKDVLGL